VQALLLKMYSLGTEPPSVQLTENSRSRSRPTARFPALRPSSFMGNPDLAGVDVKPRGGPRIARALH